MGWWKLDDGRVVGDGPLDLAEEFLSDVSREYLNDQRRKPTLEEILASLAAVLRNRADEFTEDSADVVIEDLLAKTRKRPKKQQIQVGDVFAVPLGDGSLGFGRVTPQVSF